MTTSNNLTALRRLPRPAGVYPCVNCAAVVGTNYPTCPTCFLAIERYWLADWDAFLAQEKIQPGSADEQTIAHIIIDEVERHPWTVLDIAMTLLTCNSCGSELGGGPPDCTECAAAWGNTLWAEHYAARLGLVTGNEHALHVGRMILRHSHRQSASIFAAWRRSTPRLLTGWLPTTEFAQRYMALIKAGRLAEVDAALHELDQTLSMRLA
ncbi:MAG: hypothetical protein IT328_02215 [Caldilineaceae bacterium]|nr:hypothetical protein [Caldilineaceae bacterium]